MTRDPAPGTDTVHRLGVDVGGTSVHGVLLADDLVVAEVVRPSGRGREEVSGTIRSVVTELRAAVPSPSLPVSTGLGMPGLVTGGSVTHAVNLGIDDEPFDALALLESCGPGATAVENDVKVAALGALRWLSQSEPGVDDLALLNVGTGLAAGLVLDGRLRHGARGLAGEIGHVVHDPAGPECPCGQRGCLELYASGSGLQRRWGGTAAELFTAAVTGDEDAADVAEQLVRGLVQAVVLLVHSTDVARVVVTGGVVSATPALRDAVLDRLTKQATTPLGAAAAAAERIRWLPSSHPAGAIGAALLVEEPPWRS